MSDASKKSTTVTNRILAGLPRKDYARILPDLAPVTLEFGQVLYEPGTVQLSQSSVCNRFHTIRERLCRWLLASQEFLARMLGV